MFGAVMAAISVATGAYTAYQQREAGKAEKAMADAQAQQQIESAKRETERAGLAQVQAENETRRRYTTLSQDIGSIYATAAGNGVLLNSGSVDSIIRANVSEANADVSSIFDQGNLNIKGHNDNMLAHLSQARLTRYGGQQAMAAAKSQAGGTLLSSAGSAVSSGVSGYNLGTAVNKRYGSDRWFSDPLLK